ncbi:MAG: SRPBCC family protein [Bacteroidota bacterium]
MPKIELKTKINAPQTLVFDLSRSIDLHKISTAQTNETAIAGKTNGLLGLNEWVIWRAKHLGFYQTLTSKITEFESPNYFVDEMVKGGFKSFRHEHHFKKQKSGTLMLDVFSFESPFSFIGHLANKLFLTEYMKRLLEERNRAIKTFAESGEGMRLLTIK